MPLSFEIMILTGEGLKDLDEIVFYENVEKIDLSFNKLSEFINIPNLLNLMDLNLSNNQIKSIKPISHLFSLQILKLNDNKISEIGYLANLRKLKRLHLSNNEIVDTSNLKSLHGNDYNLHELYLDGNKLSNLQQVCKDLCGLVHLNKLTLYSVDGKSINPLCCEDDYNQKIITSLPNLEILDGISDIEIITSVQKAYIKPNNNEMEELFKCFISKKMKNYFNKFQKENPHMKDSSSSDEENVKYKKYKKNKTSKTQSKSFLNRKKEVSKYSDLVRDLEKYKNMSYLSEQKIIELSQDLTSEKILNNTKIAEFRTIELEFKEQISKLSVDFDTKNNENKLLEEKLEKVENLLKKNTEEFDKVSNSYKIKISKIEHDQEEINVIATKMKMKIDELREKCCNYLAVMRKHKYEKIQLENQISTLNEALTEMEKSHNADLENRIHLKSPQFRQEIFKKVSQVEEKFKLEMDTFKKQNECEISTYIRRVKNLELDIYNEKIKNETMNLASEETNKTVIDLKTKNIQLENCIKKSSLKYESKLKETEQNLIYAKDEAIIDQTSNKNLIDDLNEKLSNSYEKYESIANEFKKFKNEYCKYKLENNTISSNNETLQNELMTKQEEIDKLKKNLTNKTQNFENETNTLKNNFEIEIKTKTNDHDEILKKLKESHQINLENQKMYKNLKEEIKNDGDKKMNIINSLQENIYKLKDRKNELKQELMARYEENKYLKEENISKDNICIAKSTEIVQYEKNVKELKRKFEEIESEFISSYEKKLAESIKKIETEKNIEYIQFNEKYNSLLNQFTDLQNTNAINEKNLKRIRKCLKISEME
ncbi:hypothetical protein A3Q56_01566 [Intoshia linei]|uniref:Leucine-rich repeat and coiled-coil domain-containing protein 1 n=1 Tax=Intoshia linei TaxID=1819745 RepID=A0A177B8R4_9BILA|nr:hypothetical protein A3Q56_01566 [Intoshia linei]